MNYGFVDNTTNKNETIENSQKSSTEVVTDKVDETSPPSQEQESSGRKRKAQAPPPKWFDMPPEHNSKVYVSNLPNDITEEEFGQLMSKCGLVMKDLKNGKLKLKLYRDANGELKGDGLCHYIKVSSFTFPPTFNEVTFYIHISNLL